MLNLIVLLATVATVFCEQTSYHFVKLEGEKRIPQDIVHDTDANTVVITVGDISKYEDKIPTVNFHDFDTGYVVFKDIKRQLCLLSISPIPFPTPFLYNMGETDLTLDYEAAIRSNIMSTEEVTEMAGKRISSYCKDYKTRYMTLKKMESGTNTKRETKGTCSQHCGTCYIVMPREEYESVSVLG